jgi:hypothetical protein
MTGIGIKLNSSDTFLTLKPKPTIMLQLENPTLGGVDKLSPGSISFPFTLPGAEDAPENAAQLGNPDVVENKTKVVTAGAGLYYDGSLFKQGNLKLKDNQGKDIVSNFVFGLNTISPDFKNARLRDVVAEVINISSSNIQKIVYAKPRRVGDAYKLEINGRVFSGRYTTLGDTIVDKINNAAADKEDTDEWVPVADAVGSGSTPGGLAAPYIKLRMAKVYSASATVYATDPLITLAVRDVTDVATLMKISIDDLFHDGIPAYRFEGNLDTYYSEFQTFLAGYISGAYPTDKIRFPFMLNSNLYGDKVANTDLSRVKTTDYINAVDSGGLLLNDANDGAAEYTFLPLNQNSLQPFIRMKWVLEKIAEHFGFELEGDFLTNGEIDERLLYNTACLDVPLDYIGDKKFVFWRRSFNLSELVPDISVPDFLMWIQDRYNLAVYQNERTGAVRLQYREPIVRSYSFVDITRSSSPKKGSETMGITGIRVKVLKDGNDQLSVDDVYELATPEKDLIIKCGAIRNTGTAAIDGGTLTAPKVAQVMESDFALRIFEYKGLVSSGAFNYPGAGIDGPDQVESITALVSDKHLYSLMNIINREAITIETDFCLRELVNFNWETKYRFDRFNYIIKSIEVKLTDDGPERSTVELYTA